VAAAADAQISSELVPGGPEPERDRGAELGAMLQMGVLMVSPALPFLPQCYTPQACTQIGTAFAAVADKRGWDLDAITSPELALAAVAIPPTVAAVALGKQYFADKRRQAEAAEKGTEPAAAAA
jgi:hypothetical protein